ncbi:cytochrome c3 family protein [uncultured Desulfosarcina sp.]|uniref:cytochrome c3 family protein n=1 Tax=uncultured Desulfosarcina sp. TaxID=218289 RepID=UPI0029C643F6|nr:cytochrome c3 family protein [uncultured Desulfosarcina sp.]
MKPNPLVIAVAAAVLGFFAAIAAAANHGPETINIFGGQSGNVPFTHAQHQNRLNDCNVCHSIFPQETDAIKRMKESGALKPKKVMNLQCIKCHKEEKRAGKPHGPITCSTCHKK